MPWDGMVSPITSSILLLNKHIVVYCSLCLTLRSVAPVNPKETKSKPGAKAGRPRKDALKTMGPNPHKTLHLKMQVYIIFSSFEVEIFFFHILSDLV